MFEDLWPNDAAVQNDEAYTRLLLMNEQQAKVESKKEKVENAGEPITNNEELINHFGSGRKVGSRKNPRSMPHRTPAGAGRAFKKQHRAADAPRSFTKNINLTPRRAYSLGAGRPCRRPGRERQNGRRPRAKRSKSRSTISCRKRRELVESRK